MTASRDPQSQLPELPLEELESIGPLERSDHGPFLTIKPPRAEALLTSAPMTVPTRASRMVQVHFAWVSYPIVVCYDPGPFVDGLQIATEPLDGPRPGLSGDDLPELAGQVRHHRLSTWAGQKLPRPLWCTTRQGPWHGKFVEQESCTAGDNVHMFEFTIEGVDPDQTPGVVSWLGSIGDIPVVSGLSIAWGTLVSKNPTWEPCREPGYPKPISPA